MKDSYILDKADKMVTGQGRHVSSCIRSRESMRSLLEVDDDPRAAYFKQGTVRRLCPNGTDL